MYYITTHLHLVESAYTKPQLHRFIELTKKRNVNLEDKFVTQISTSKHFYDVTAHKYIEENVLDLGMRYIRGLSADMEDLLSQEGRKEAEKFFQRFLWSLKEGIYTKRTERSSIFQPIEATVPESNADDKSDEKDIRFIDSHSKWRL